MNCLIASLTFASLALVNVQGDDLYVLNYPENVKINQSTPVQNTELADIILSMMGFTVPRAAKTWSNLLVADPFLLPETVVVLEIPGLKNPGFDLNKVEHHNLVKDEPLVEVYNTVKQMINQRLSDNQYSILYGSLTNEEFLKTPIFNPNVQTTYPNIIPEPIHTRDEYNSVFFKEMYHLQQLTEGVKEVNLKKNLANFHWFQLQGVKSLIAVHGSTSIELINDNDILIQTISAVVQSYNEIYDGQVFFVVITNDGLKSPRKKRNADSVEAKLNVAEPLSSDFPIIFNILLWFTVVFIFSLLATALSISQMDPGRDSIIYRMTSNRMKKEN